MQQAAYAKYIDILKVISHAEDDEVHDADGDIQKLLGELEYIQEG